MFGPCRGVLLIATLLGGLATAAAAERLATRDALWAAVRAGDVKAVKAAIDKGADVNAKNEIGVSSLWIAASKGKLDVIELLVKRGADVNVRDGIWYQTPLSMAAPEKKVDAAKFLIKAGAKDVDAALFAAVSTGNAKMVEMILKDSKVSQDALDAALYSATSFKNAKVQQILAKAGAKALSDASEKDRQAWKKIAGTYE